MSSLNKRVVLDNYFCNNCEEEFDLLFQENSCPYCHSNLIEELANADALGLTGAEGGEALNTVDMHQIGSEVDLGLITATKTAEIIDLDDNMTANEEVESLYEDDNTVKLISTRIPQTVEKSFNESVDKWIKEFTDLSTNLTSVKRLIDERKDRLKKSNSEIKELFHKIPTLHISEKEFMADIDETEDKCLKDLKIRMNEILSKRSELREKLSQCSQTLIDLLVANPQEFDFNDTDVNADELSSD